MNRELAQLQNRISARFKELNRMKSLGYDIEPELTRIRDTCIAFGGNEAKNNYLNEIQVTEKTAFNLFNKLNYRMSNQLGRNAELERIYQAMTDLFEPSVSGYEPTNIEQARKLIQGAETSEQVVNIIMKLSETNRQDADTLIKENWETVSEYGNF